MLKNKKGFGLIQVLISMGLVGIVAVMVAELFVAQKKASTTSEMDYDILAIMKDIDTILADPASCKKSLNGTVVSNKLNVASIIQVPPATIPPTVPTPPDITRYTASSKIGNSHLILEKIELDNSGLPIKLILTFDREGRSLSSQKITKFIIMRLELDPSNVVQSCSSAGFGAEIWKREQTDPRNIYYMGGHVGIGERPLALVPPTDATFLQIVDQKLTDLRMVNYKSASSGVGVLLHSIINATDPGTYDGWGLTYHAGNTQPNNELFVLSRVHKDSSNTVEDVKSPFVIKMKDPNNIADDYYVGMFGPFGVDPAAHLHVHSDNRMAIRASSKDGNSAALQLYLGANVAAQRGWAMVNEGMTTTETTAANGNATFGTEVNSLLFNKDFTAAGSSDQTYLKFIWNQPVAVFPNAIKVYMNKLKVIDIDGVSNLNVATINGAVYPPASDIQLKKDIKPLENSLDKILQINGVSFFWKDEKYNSKNGLPSIGVIAQDVEKVYPEIINLRKDGYKTLDYTRLIAPLIEAVREQNKKIEQQSQVISELKTEIEKLKKSL